MQFTPDMMPSDITGHAVLDPATRELRVVRGPVFTHILLADEINRAPAKTQSALLEVMQEYQVTLEGQTLAVPKPFMVLATQNPVETEGTYPLPEAQLDRFLSRSRSAIPRARKRSPSWPAPPTDRPATNCRWPRSRRASTAGPLPTLQQLAAQQRVDEQVVDYAVRIARATREYPGLAVGSGSRGALALVRGARAAALIARPPLCDAGRRQASRAARAAPPRAPLRPTHCSKDARPTTCSPR